jgi:3-hydroxyisobutyrate dehydrogenase-like beta-hydroxyacid dehydrogenase
MATSRKTTKAPNPDAKTIHLHRTGETEAMPQPRVAILGTGKMGSAIARRLSGAGIDVTLWNRTRERAVALDIGHVANTPATAALDAELIVSSLTGPDAVRAAYLGPTGALASAKGKLIVEMSTAGADIVSELARHVAADGAHLVDAPLLGAPPLVLEGAAAVLVGGAKRDVAIATPVLALLGTVRHVGTLGKAARLKLVANSMLADVVLAAAELQVAGEEAGLDPKDVFWVLERLAPALEARRRGYLENRHKPAMFALRDLLKDLTFALDLVKATGAQAPLTAMSRSLVADAAWVAPDNDITGVIQPYREAATAGWTRSGRTATAERND